MDDKLHALLDRIKTLEQEVLHEIHGQEEKFGYEVHEETVRFKKAVAREHHKIAKRMSAYLREAKIFSILSAPVIWFCVVPMLFLHLVANIYQFICFPIYGIPKVRSQDYILRDRAHLRYLNFMERFNCGYCGYVNGAIAYVQEIAGRTEQYWCPIKHALALKTRHSRYHHFLDFGDASAWHERFEQVRRDFADAKQTSPPPAPRPATSEPVTRP